MGEVIVITGATSGVVAPPTGATSTPELENPVPSSTTTYTPQTVAVVVAGTRIVTVLPLPVSVAPQSVCHA